MLDVLNRPETEHVEPQQPANRAELHAAIERELRENPNRTDNAIANVVGCSNKTVTARRKELGISAGQISQPDAQVLTERHGPEIQAAVDRIRGEQLRVTEQRQAQARQQDEANGEESLLVPQLEVTIQFDDAMGHWILKQKNWPDDDSVILINEENMTAFQEALAERVRRQS